MTNPTTSVSTALTKIQLEDTDQAGKLFRNLLNKGENAALVRATIHENPRTALMALAKGDTALGNLTTKQSADVLEVALEKLSREEAASLMQDHLTPDRQIELLRARGDLPSIAAEYVSIDILLPAVLEDIEKIKRTEEEDRGSLSDHASIFRFWAHKLKERKDYEEVLSKETEEGYFFKDLLLIALWIDAKYDVITTDALQEVGLEVEDLQRLNQLVSMQAAIDETATPEAIAWQIFGKKHDTRIGDLDDDEDDDDIEEKDEETEQGNSAT